MPEYFVRLIQADFFKAYLWRNKVGAEGRKEVKLDFFESIRIPLPPVETQRTIIAEWQKAQEAIVAGENRIRQIKAEIEAQLFTDLELKTFNKNKPSKSLVVKWKDFSRWSVGFNQTLFYATDITKGKYPVVDVGSILELLQYGTSEKANGKDSGIPVIRMGNIVSGILDLSDLKYIELSKNEHVKLLLRKGDILFNRTNSKELVGKCAVFNEEGDYVFASYLIRIRTDNQKAAPEFVAHVINSPIGRRQIDALSRQIIGQANINSEELRSLQIPLPPLKMQHEIMRRVQINRDIIDLEERKRCTLAQSAAKDVEEMILGIRPVQQ